MARLSLMVHFHLNNLKVENLASPKCIKNSKGHFHISYCDPNNQNSYITISNETYLSITNKEKNQIEKLRNENIIHSLRLGGDSLQNKTKKEYNKLIKELKIFYREFLWLQNHVYDSLNPKCCFFMSLDAERQWHIVAPSESKNYVVRLGDQSHINQVVSKMKHFAPPEYFELLVESKNLMNISPASSLILAVSCLESLFRTFLKLKYPNLKLDFITIKTLINPTMQLLNEVRVVSLGKGNIDKINGLVDERNKIIHTGIIPTNIDKLANSANEIVVDIVKLLELELFSYKNFPIPKALEEINKDCLISRNFAKSE